MVSRTHLRSIRPISFCFGFRHLYRFAILGLTLLCPVVCGIAQDENATRDPIPSTRTKPPKPENGGRHIRKPPPPNRAARVAIKVDPPDSTVYFDGQQFDTADPTTGLRLTGLQPGPHTLTVRHPPAYAEREQIISLKPGENEPIKITLELLIGKLDVVPSVGDAQIRIENVDVSPPVHLGTYPDGVNSLALAPGLYDITIAKSGYQTATRRITIRPGESMFLEPQLLPLPTPTPTPTPVPVPTRVLTAVPSRAVVEVTGKYFMVQLRGASGDVTRRVGSINVVLNAQGGNTVTGALPGQACQVLFVQLENVAEGSLVEAPGPSNQWAKTVVRVRPKSNKRPVAFTINWTALEDSSTVPSNLTQEFVEAVPIQKVRPSFPPLARNLGLSGTVSVLVAIDAQGNVVSAKAMDGPSVLRSAAEDAARKWKFQPAMENGQPIESTQTIRFAFER